MSRVVRAAMTQTRNAYRAMPPSVDALDGLADHLDDIREANLAHHEHLVAEAAARGVQAVCFGELFTGPYFAHDRHPLWFGLAEDAEHGPTAERIRALARRHQMVVVAPLYEQDGERRYNTAIVVDADGAWLGRYRKTHIPVGANETGPFCESFYYGAGDALPVFPTAVGTLGVAICYDRHFDGVVRTLAHRGAELVFSPAVTFGEVSQRMWPLEFAVDAVRHRVFVGGSNRLGVEPPWTVDFFGNTHFVDFDGRRLPDVSDHPEVIASDLDLDRLGSRSASGWKLTADRRPTLYDR